MTTAAQPAQSLAALEAVMRSNNQRLYRVARAMLGNGAEAEDALQEAYLSAFRSLDGFRGEAMVSTWLARIVVNECTSRLRRQARRDNIVPIVPDQPLVRPEKDEMHEPPHAARDEETPDRALLRAEVRALLERKIDELPQDFRTVFVMRSVEEMTVEETAACLAIPVATVRSRHFRARNMLRAAIAQDFDLAEQDAFGFAGEQCDRIVANVLRRIDSGR